MDKYESFIQTLRSSGEKFKKSSPKSVKIIGHHDTDGLCSVAILELALEREKIPFETINVQQLDEHFLKNSCKEDTIVFVDIGSTSQELISKTLKKKDIYILDHHNPNTEETFKKITLLNPYTSEIDEDNSIAGAGVVYFFTQGINSSNKEQAKLAVLGAIGDTQANDGFEVLNSTILQHAILQKQISISKELKLYGKNSRPLIKVLEYSTDLDIPGVTNNYRGVVALLKELQIPLNFRGRPRRWYQLKEEEKDAITDRILDLKPDVEIEDMTINTYKFNNYSKRELRYGREFATIINSCGRLDDYRTAIDALKGDIKAQDKAVQNLRTYKTSIHEGIKLFESFREEGKLIGNDNLVIFDTEDRVKPSIVGVIASIVARNKYYPEGVLICSLSNLNETMLKISLRVSRDKTDLNLAEFLEKIVSDFGASAGGHSNAAGAILPIEKRKEFIEKLTSSFE